MITKASGEWIFLKVGLTEPNNIMTVNDATQSIYN